MKVTGMINELDIDLTEYEYDVDEAVVTKDRIAIDWKEDGDPFHALLKSFDGGVTYSGHYGSPQPDRECVMEATKYIAADKSILLLVTWCQRESGNTGTSLIRLVPRDK